MARLRRIVIWPVIVLVVVMTAVAVYFLVIDEKSMEPLAGWQSKDIGHGTLHAPPELEDVWSGPGENLEFKSQTMRVYSTGSAPGLPSVPIGTVQVKQKSGRLDGHKVELYSFFQLVGDNLPGESFGHWEVAQVTRNISNFRMRIWVTYSDPADAETAKRIVRAFSIK